MLQSCVHQLSARPYHRRLMDEHRERRARLWPAPKTTPADVAHVATQAPETKGKEHPARERLSVEMFLARLLAQPFICHERPSKPRRVTVEDIQRVAARKYNMSRADLLSSRRTADIVRPRQIAMYLAKVLTLRSLPDIARRFGGRDHTTVLHAFRKIEGLVGTDAGLAQEIESLKLELQDRSTWQQ